MQCNCFIEVKEGEGCITVTEQKTQRITTQAGSAYGPAFFIPLTQSSNRSPELYVRNFNLLNLSET